MRTFLAFFRIYRSGFLRFLVSIPSSTLLSVVAALLSVALANSSPTPPEFLKSHPATFTWLFFVGLGLLLIQTWNAYLQTTFDISAISKYDDKFQKEMSEERFTACSKVLEAFREDDEAKKIEISEDETIEPVLDVFEDLGLLVHGNRISDVLVHHYFYHWFMVYAQPLEAYFACLHNEHRPEYKYLRRLYDRMRSFERIDLGWFGIPYMGKLGPIREKYILDEIDENKPDQ